MTSPTINDSQCTKGEAWDAATATEDKEYNDSIRAVICTTAGNLVFNPLYDENTEITIGLTAGAIFTVFAIKRVKSTSTGAYILGR